MRLYLIRHPLTLATPDTCYGSSDVQVDSRDLEHCLRRLPGPPSLPRGLPVYASPLSRCAGLAQRLTESWGAAPPILDARLKEMDFGAWELRAWADIPRAEVDEWAADMIGYRPGGGENVLQMAQRLRNFREDLLSRGQDACVVCHAGSIRLLVGLHGGRTLREAALAAARATVRIPYGQLIILPPAFPGAIAKTAGRP